jgi:hypothetical protein
MASSIRNLVFILANLSPISVTALPHTPADVYKALQVLRLAIRMRAVSAP